MKWLKVLKFLFQKRKLRTVYFIFFNNANYGIYFGNRKRGNRF